MKQIMVNITLQMDEELNRMLTEQAHIQHRSKRNLATLLLKEALKNAGQHNTSGRRNARNALINDREQNYAPWTDIPKIIDEWRLQDRAG